MSKHISTRRESRNGASVDRTARLPCGSLPLRRTWPISLCIGLAIGSIAVSPDAFAGGPTGGTVVGGTGSITQNGNETVINQISQRLALNWETFNLNANESVLFNQPGRSAVALNRILDQNPSQIFGKINSNGQVFLINTHGIIFGATAQMNVGGLMASTLDLTPKDFLAGNYSLNAVGAGAGIVNHGLIQAASGGSVALVGGSVANDGVILANYGSINLDGAEHAVLDFDGNGLINIQITGELKQRLDDREAAVSNTGTLKAEGGTVVLQASAAKDLFTNLVNNSGVIDASGISTDGGVVRLVGNGGNVQSSGSIAATGDHGGRIELLSDHDVMVTGGTLDASGRLGGGAIRVGGGIRGGEGLAVAARTYIGPDASLNADATGKGDGGSIAVFSRDNSVIAGGLSARGGIDGGNGGFVETSSHGALTITGTPQVFARSADGLGGNWLIDPNNITIVAGSGNTKINSTNPFVSTNDGASLGVDLITAALTGGANVTVTTGTGGSNSEAGDITLNADLDYNGKGSNSLTFNAANDIVINNKIFDSVLGGDVLNLSLLAGGNISLNNDISLGTGSTATLTASGGSISRTAGTISAGALTLTAGGTNGSIGASDAIQTSVDSITFSAKGTGAVNIVDADAVNVSGTAGSGNVGITTTTSDLGVVGSGIVTAGGAVTLEAAGGGARINIGTGVAVDTTNGNSVAAGANVSLVADNADILGTINAGTAGIVAIRQATAGRPISLGPDAPSPAPPQLGLTSTELDQITANAIVIGDANSGNLSINEAIAPAHATTLSLNTGGTISQVGGATITVGTLTGSSAGATTLGEANQIGNLGSFTASSFSLTNAAALTLVGNVTTSGAQIYNTALVLGGDRVLSGSDITFASTINGAHALSIVGSGVTTFAGAVGGLNALTSLTTDAGGSTLLGGIITTSGTQTYNDAVTLGSDAVLTTTDSAVNFVGTVDNATTTARALTVNAGTGSVTFGGAVGSNATNGALGGLTTQSGSWSANALNIGSGGLSVTTTTGDITQGGKFVVTGLSGFNAGGHAITLENTGNDFQNNVSATGIGVSITDINDLAITTLSSGLNGKLSLIAGGVLTLPVGAIDTGSADLTLASNGGAFTPSGDLSGANISLSGLGLVLNNNVTTAGTLNLSSGATISQGAGVITAATLTGSSAGSTTLTGANLIGTLGNFTAASFALTNAQALTVSGPVNGGTSTTLTTTTGDLAINGAVNGTTTTLTSAGAITEGAAGVITAGTLTGSSVGSTTLNGANLIGTLGNFTAANFALTNAQALAVNGSVNGGTSTALTTTTGNLAINGAVNGTTTTLTSAGAITEGAAGVITAGTLTGSSAGSTTLNGANVVGALGAFTTGGNFSFNNTQTLTVTNAPSANGGAGNLTLTTAGASSDLILASNLTGNTVTLSAGRNINQTSGAITATTLTGSSVGSTTLNGANLIGTLGNFTANGFVLTDTQALTLAGVVNSGTGLAAINAGVNPLTVAGSVLSNGNALSLTAGDLILNGAVNAGMGTTTLTSAGAITEGTAGVITAGTLTGSSVGSTTLNGANVVGALGAFTTGGNFSFNNTQTLTVTNAPSANGGAGNLTLTTAGASSDLILASNLTGNTITLSAGRNINQTSGAITATTLTGSSVGSTTLNGANLIGTLGNFTAANFALTNAQALAVNGSVNGGTSTTLTTTTGDLAINGAVNGATTTLTSAGAITEGAAGVITAGTLTGSSVGSTTLNGANVVGALGAFTTGGNFSFNNTQTLTVTNAPSANGGLGNLTLTTSGASSDLILASNLTGDTVTLSAGRNINQTSGAITATTLTGSSAGSTTLNGANLIGTLGNFTAANFALTNAQALAVTGPVNGGASTTLRTTAGNLAINGAVNGTTTTLTSAGAITEGAAGVITAGTLTGSSVGSTTLTGANLIGTLGNFTAANFALTNAQALAVNGPVNGGASTTLTTTTGDLAINGAVNGTTTTLTSAGAITEGAAGVITAGTLTGSSAGSTTLNGANVVGALGAFTTGGNFSFNNTQTLTVTNAPSANGGAGNLTLTTAGASSDLILASNLTGNTITLSAGRNINQTSGAITATTLTGSSVGSTTLTGANLIGTLGNFTAANFTLTNAQALAVSGPVNGGASASLKTTTGNLVINGAVDGTTTTLTSAGAITEGAAGVITAGTLTGSSVGSTTLNGANVVGALGAFITGGNFSFNNTQTLTVTNAPSANGGLGNLTLTTSGASSDLILASNLTGNTVTLSAGRNINQTSGAITATTLTGSSAGSTTLNGANLIGTLGNFTAANFALTNAQALAVTGPVNGGASTTLRTTAGNLAINGAVNGTTTTLTSAGAITEGAAGVITAGTLTGSSAGSTTLTGANLIGTLGNFTAANFALTNAQALAVNGPVNGGASTTLKTTAGNLAINGAVNGTTTTLTSAGAITEGAGGLITAGTLTGSSAGSTVLLRANRVGALGAFATGGDFAFNNAQSLTVSNAPSANGGAGNLTLTTTGASSDLTLASNLVGNTVTLGAGRNINQTGGTITATTLTGSSVGSTTLNGTNHIGALGNFTAANFALTNAQTLAVSGPVDGGASTALTTTAGDLAINGLVKGATTTLVSAGAITEGAGGSITANLLTGHSIGNTTLDGNNHINILGGFSADFSLTNGQTLTVEGPLDGGPVVALTTTAGDLIINGTVTGAITTLTSAGAIIEGVNGVISADTLTGSSAGSTSLLGANQVAALGAFVSGGDFGFNTIQTLTVNDAPSANGGAGNLTLTASGASSDLILASTLTGNTVTLGAGRSINQTAGSIHATTLTGSSVGSTTLNGANRIGTLGSFTAAGFALTNAQALAVTGAVDGGASTSLKTISGDLAINGSVKGTTTTLTSAGAITEGAAGSITAGTLTGSSAGATTLNGTNRIGTLGSFTAASFALSNAQALAVSGTLDGGASASLKTTSGDLAINGAVKGTATTLTSAGAITEGAAGIITAGTLTGSSVGATTLNGANQIGTLGSFTAANFALTNAQALTVGGPLDGGASTSLKTTSGDLAINGSVKGTATTLTSAGAISEGAGGIITAGTLSGSAVGPTVLGSAGSPNKNMVDTLGNFTSLAGFSMTNDKTLTLASVAGSAFTVNAGTSSVYLSVTHGDLFQLGTTPLYDGVGMWGSTGRLGSSSQPIYVVGTGLQSIANVGLPPAYFYAVDSSGNLLPLGGGFAINVPTASGAGSAQNGNHGDSYIDPSVITANYRSYGIVPSGVRLPADQQSGCDPDQPDQAACQDPDALGMVMPWPKAPQ